MAIPIFDEKITRLEEFDPRLVERLRLMGGANSRKLLFTAIDGTATEPTWDPAVLELVVGFLENCEAWYKNGGEVSWICRRGVTLGAGNLISLHKEHYYIKITGCDGNEAFIDGTVKCFKQQAPFFNHLGQLADLQRLFDGIPISIIPMGYSILAVFINWRDVGYRSFELMMYEIAKRLEEETGQRYCTIPHSAGIVIEPVHKVGKVHAIKRARESSDRAIGLEVYAGSDQADILAMLEVNSKPYGFAYKVYSDRAELDAAAAADPDVLYYVSGLIDGPEQWSRLIGMIAERLQSA